LHGAGAQAHSADCPLLQARLARQASPVPPRPVERPAIVSAPPPSAWTPASPRPAPAATRPKARRRGLWDPEEIERREQLIARILKSERPPSEYHVSAFVSDRDHKYIDLRVYKGRAGQLPTGNGLAIHIEKLPDIIEALRDALRRETEPSWTAPRGVMRDE
jgi:hypothetical protein